MEVEVRFCFTHSILQRKGNQKDCIGISLERMACLGPRRSRAAQAAACAVGGGQALVRQSAGRRGDDVGDQGCGGAAAQAAVLQTDQADDDAAGGVGLQDVGDQRPD